MLRSQFQECLNLIAVGLVGSGSECFGYDDAISTDHDFEPGFCIFIPDEDLIDRKTAFALERAYDKLPRTFGGFHRNLLHPVGGNRHGVIRIDDFLIDKTGKADANLTLNDWFSIPEQSLLEATAGKLFYDGLGYFTEIRNNLSYFPEDIRRKKLAGELLLMAQAGQYNYRRCIERCDSAAAQLAVIEFVNSTMHAIFLLNKHYLPYYKWRFHALRSLPYLSERATELEWLISSPNTSKEAVKKQSAVEQIATEIVQALQVQGMSDIRSTDLEQHAYAVNNHISDAQIRNLHILYGV